MSDRDETQIAVQLREHELMFIYDWLTRASILARAAPNEDCGDVIDEIRIRLHREWYAERLAHERRAAHNAAARAEHERQAEQRRQADEAEQAAAIRRRAAQVDARKARRGKAAK